jgi:hypothetical protein
MHVIAHLLTLVAVGCLVFPDAALFILRSTTALLTLPAVGLAGYFSMRGVLRGEAEAEFAAWYRVPPDATLLFRNGRWVVEALPSATEADSRSPPLRTS